MEECRICYQHCEHSLTTKALHQTAVVLCGVWLLAVWEQRFTNVNCFTEMRDLLLEEAHAISGPFYNHQYPLFVSVVATVTETAESLFELLLS